MKGTNRTFFICLILALVLLSLPLKTNAYLLHALSEKLLVFSAFSPANDEEAHTESAVEQWQNEQAAKKERADSMAARKVPKELSYIVGKVIYRTENSWNSSLWIDIGEDDNPDSGPAIIAKNSPVLSRDCLVGVIDYVGKHASLVRLISDSALQPAVRAARCSFDRDLVTAIAKIREEKGLLEREDEQKALLFLLAKLSEKITPEVPQFLAKGILSGNCEPMWRSKGISLKGSGFTYDFKDEWGPARDLRTGEPIDPDNEFPEATKTAIIQTGDLLVTSGLDGLFPEGLLVAKVTEIVPLQEGAYTYEVIATPSASDILDLVYVTVLPPQKFVSEKLPSRVDFIQKLLEE